MHDTADLEKLVLAMHHVFAGQPSDGVIFAQENRLFRTNLLAHAAKNAANHVDIEFFRILLHFGESIGWWNFAGHNFDRARWANKLAKLTGDTANAVIGVAHERRGAAVIFRQAVIPFFLGIL